MSDLTKTKSREVYFGLNSHKLNSKFPNNKISTTKYNFITWFPKSLLMQFTRAANIFFLLVSCIVLTPISPKKPGNTLGTFATVLLLTMIKEAYEDLLRWNNDKKENSNKSLVYNYKNTSFEQTSWQNIKVGNIIKVLSSEPIPCDIMILKSSSENGVSFVDTKSLDGETTLKDKMAFDILNKLTEVEILNLNSKITCDEANDSLVNWDCNFEIFSDKKDLKTEIFGNIKNLLLKGSTLRNTSYIIGIAIYTGHSCKVMKNAKDPKTKISKLMKTMNYLLFSIIVYLSSVCIIFSFIYLSWENNIGKDLSYLQKYKKGILGLRVANGFAWFKRAITYHSAFNQVIPISLYVALEVLKLFQAKLISRDPTMYDKNSESFALSRTSDLIDELGQVELIFSDKTGTLTQNEMIFKKCSVNMKIYEENDPELKTKNVEDYVQVKSNKFGKNIENGMIIESHDEQNKIFKCEEIYSILNSPLNSEYESMNYFFSICAICHEAYIEDSTFHSSSPDEIALVNAAKKYGISFVSKSSGTIDIYNLYTKKTEVWNILLILKFDPVRKRMSIIVKNNEKYYLFVKGADSHMIPFLNDNEVTKEKINEDILYFSKQGLRTLVFAKKELTEEQVDDILNKYHKILHNQENKHNKDNLILDFFNEVETNFNYIGTSAIEDKLQDNVADTIETLISVNIKVWILTGDKKETAFEIAKSCRLVNSDFTLLDFSFEDNKDLISILSSKINTVFYSLYSEQEENEIRKGNMYSDKYLLANNNNCKKLVIVDGLSLSIIFESNELSKKFFRICMVSDSVICCRVSPKQKSQVVKLAKSNCNLVTLSIGDGENDIPMIIQANIGVGIIGKEGSGASRSADYSIGQFSFLKNLLFYHGRVGYKRISTFLCYYFYKNIMMVLPEMIFANYSGYSGQIFYPDFGPLLYNKLWTSYPCIFSYSLERDLDADTSLKFPMLYKAGQQNYYFNLKVFWKWIVNAYVHGFLVYYIVTLTLENSISENGKIHDNWFKSTVAFSLVIHIVNYKILIDSQYWNYVNIGSGIFSLVLYYFTMFILCLPSAAHSVNPELVKKIYSTLSFYKVWLLLLIGPFAVLTPDFALRIINKLFYPSPSEILELNSTEILKTKQTEKININTEVNLLL